MRRRRPRVPADHRVSVPGVTCPNEAAQKQYERSLANYDKLPEGARKAIQEYGDAAIKIINMGHREYTAIMLILKQKGVIKSV